MIRTRQEKHKVSDSCTTRMPQLVWGMRERFLKATLFHVSEHAGIYPHLFTKIKKSNTVPSCTVGTNKASWHLILAETGLRAKREG